MNNPPLTDPIIRPAAICSGKSGHLCGAVMNPIHIYEGKGARPEMRGATCGSRPLRCMAVTSLNLLSKS
jgi:hypothetical protein